MKGLIGLLLTVCLCAASDRSVLAIQAKLFPQVVLFDTKLIDKRVNSEIVVVVTGNSSDVTLFVQIAKEIYGDSIKGQNIKWVAMRPYEISQRTPMSALVVLDDDEELLRKLDEISRLKSVIMFVDDPESLNFSGVVGVDVTNKVRPVLSANGMKRHQIIFSSGFIALARIVSE